MIMIQIQILHSVRDHKLEVVKFLVGTAHLKLTLPLKNPTIYLKSEKLVLT